MTWSVVALVVVAAAATIVLVAGGRFLVVSDAFAEADVAVVLSGGPVVRVLAARDLYRSGRVRRIVIIPEPADDAAADRELVALGLKDPSARPYAERILLASGLSPAVFEFLPQPVDGTVNEALAVKRFLDRSVAQRVAVVTSKFASRRACLIFRSVLSGREVYCVASPYDPFDPNRWWREPRNALMTIMEYQKLVVNAVSLVVMAAFPP